MTYSSLIFMHTHRKARDLNSRALKFKTKTT